MRKNEIYYALAALALLLFFFKKQVMAAVSVATAALPGGNQDISGRTSYLGKSGFPISMRNNNPGNIRVSSSPWKGKLTIHPENTDKRFEVFKDFIFGIRAMIKTLQSYNTKHGITTIAGIVNRWAPAADGNNVTNYISSIVNATGFSDDEEIVFNRENLMGIVRAMADVESGRKETVSVTDFNTAWSEL